MKMKQKKMRKIGIASALGLVVLVMLGLYGASNYMLNYSLNYPKEERMTAEHWKNRMKNECPWMIGWMDSVYQHHCVKDTFVVMPSGYKAHAIYLYAPKTTEKTAVVVHGYQVRSEGMLHIAYLYNHDMGYNVLLPDLYGHGESEGDHIQMGWKDRWDVIRWSEVANEIFKVKSEERRVKKQRSASEGKANSTALLIIKFKVQCSKFNVMKKILFIFMLLGMVQSIMAQPAARRKQAQQKAQQSNADNMTLRAKLYFPTAIPMDEDVVWRRDIYRELNLTDDANAALYYPVEPTDGKMNLFTYIFKLMFTGRVPVYQYRMDGNEDFSAANRLTPKAFVDNYHIYYEKTDNGKVHIDDSDIPSAEVKAYYVKETSYYDQKTASFHTKVLALCPIMTRNDDFGDVGNKYPLFWVKYDDLAPFLAKQQLMTSNVNNAAVMSAEDFFTKNLYRGKIYKTNNMQGNTLAQYCPSDSAMAKEQKRIEAELAAFEKNIWGNQARKDSLDSIAKAEKNMDAKTLKKKRNRRSGSASKSAKTSTVKKRRSGGSNVSSGGSARVTVRRERH